MNPKTVQFQYDINRMDAVNLVATIHIDDYDMRFLEVLLCERGGAFDVSGSTATARFVTLAGELLNDSVPCAVEGNAVTVPVDAAAVKSQACTLKIEINLTKDGKALTLPFPLWIRVRGSILDDARITPESEGTIPELLKAVEEELERVQGFVTSNDVYNILDHTLQGAQNVAPSLYVEPKGNNYALVYEDSEDVKHELFDFSNLPSGGTSDYTELENKPSINNVTLQGNKSSNDLGLQPLINNYFTVENNEYLSYDFNSVRADVNSVLYCVPFERILNFPNSLVGKISQSGKLYIFHYVHLTVGARYLIRRIMGYDLNAKYAEFAQYCTVGNENTVVSQSDWVELTGGGSQIVSGVVNANGTITFTDSDGNTFTTTGLSVIGADGVGIADVHIDGGGDLIIENTDGHMENVGHVVGADGQDYVLTPQDKSDIADIVLNELPTTQGVLYGNTSN